MATTDTHEGFYGWLNKVFEPIDTAVGPSRSKHKPACEMRAKVGMLRVEQQLQALRAVGHKQGLQGPQVQLLHVQTIPDLLAQVLLHRRLPEDLTSAGLMMIIDKKEQQKYQMSLSYRSLREQKLSFVRPNALSQLVLKFWLVQKLWILLHSVFFPFMQMYFCYKEAWLKKLWLFFSLLGMQYLLNIRVVLLAQSLIPDGFRYLLLGRWLLASSLQSILSSLPLKQLYYEIVLVLSFSQSTDLYCSRGSTITILDRSLEYEYFQSSPFCTFISVSRLYKTLRLECDFYSISMTFSVFLGWMGSICSLPLSMPPKLLLF